MDSLRVIKYGNPILRLKATKVETIDDSVKQLITEMIEMMRLEEGIGLAAPQVAQSISLLVVDESLISEEGKPSAYINPEILASEGESVFEEGCLSIPGIREEVKRPEKITVRYTNADGEVIERQIDGLLARVLQHEIDHLNGVLFIDRISSLKKQLLRRQLKEILDEEEAVMKEVA
ncbi:MAG: peptide deformylase [Candidatus Zhuqueibacterota bacterium]